MINVYQGAITVMGRYIVSTNREQSLPRKAGGAQDWPHATWTRFMMKKGAQHTMKAEKTWDKMGSGDQ